jgi:excinuclease ABC subunit A
MFPEVIVIRGAKEHNLKKVDITLPRHKLIVLTGVSGSGKSSLAFDTLYAEGQRRYVESLSTFARQFIGQMEKPKVDYIGGLSPAIAIEQKPVSRNPRSTVATVTEVADYLRVLFARVGRPHCYNCGKELHAQSAEEIVEQVAELEPDSRFQVLAPLARQRKGTFKDVFAQAKADGFNRVRVDGENHDLTEKIKLNKNKKHTIDLVVDRLVSREKNTDVYRDFLTRLTDSIETALKMGEGQVVIDRGSEGDWLLSESLSCPECGISFPEMEPTMFSFNSPLGMCPECNGLGELYEFDIDLVIDPTKTVGEGAVRFWGELNKKKNSYTLKAAKQILEKFDVDFDTPWTEIPEDCHQAILQGGVEVKGVWENERGSGEFAYETEGVMNILRRRYKQTSSEGSRRWYQSFMSQLPCTACEGKRLRPESLAVTIGGKNIDDVMHLNIREACQWSEQIVKELNPEEFVIAEEVLKEIQGRLTFLLNVGLHYLTLSRPAPTLSGGEGQRIRLASQIGCGLVGVLYVLDEPTIGLHQRDNKRLLETLENLRDMGNTVVVVEHDEETMRTADFIVDLGPGAGIKGGAIVAAGPLESILSNKKSLTGKYLNHELVVQSPHDKRRPVNGKWLTLAGARQNNLKSITARFPLGLFTCVTGVSGSGKSSLVAQTLQPLLSRELHRSQARAGDYDSLEGLEYVDKVVNITQDPIGRTPRSNPATYVNVWTSIRWLFAQTPEAKLRGYEAGRFSFNVKGGRCEACHGYGRKKVEMHFLPDVWVTCNVCKGKRFNRETLQIKYKGKSIADVLDMDVDEALEFFENVPKAKRILQTLSDVGMGYIKLGQSATTLSGGEAQRVKLAKELARVSTGDTVYILDEPTTGLHFADIQKLLDVLHRLTDAGNTVIVIEHNLDVIKTADWLIDLGPEGGDEGGQIVAEGTPEAVSMSDQSYTGAFLRRMLEIPDVGVDLDDRIAELERPIQVNRKTQYR